MHACDQDLKFCMDTNCMIMDVKPDIGQKNQHLKNCSNDYQRNLNQL